MSEVLWAYRTTSKRPTRVTPVTLAYGMKVIIPTEIDMSTSKTVVHDQMENDKELKRKLDWADESEKLQLSG